MKKNLTALSAALLLALVFGVHANAETLLPGADELSTTQDETYILPGLDEIAETETGPDESNAQPTETGTQIPQETVPVVTEPVSTVPTGPVVLRNDSGELRVAFNGVISDTVIPLLINDVTYVPFRAFCMQTIDGADISWDSETNTSRCESNALDIDAPFGQNYIIANGRVLYRSDANLSFANTLYVPIRSLASAIGAKVEWIEDQWCVNLLITGGPIISAEKFYNQTDLLWLARIINAESKYEPLLGKIAVGNVILNRVADANFPDTVYDVIFDCRYAVQFSPTSSSVIYNTPSEESIIAAKACLEGYTVSTEILYFMNPRLAVSDWISNNRSFVFVIGNHSFYA